MEMEVIGGQKESGNANLGQHEEQLSEEALPKPGLDSPEFESFQSEETMTVVGRQRPPDVQEAAGAHGGVRVEDIATHCQQSRRGDSPSPRTLLVIGASEVRSGRVVFGWAARLNMRMATISASFTPRSGIVIWDGSACGKSGGSTLGTRARGGPQLWLPLRIPTCPALGVQGSAFSAPSGATSIECIGAWNILLHQGSGFGVPLKKSWKNAEQPFQVFISAIVWWLGASSLRFVALCQDFGPLRGLFPFAMSLVTLPKPNRLLQRTGVCPHHHSRVGCDDCQQEWAVTKCANRARCSMYL